MSVKMILLIVYLGMCPYAKSTGTCVFKPNSCISNSICPGKQLCCWQGCGMECLDPSKIPKLTF